MHPKSAYCTKALGSTLVGHGLEIIILLINLYYDAINRKEKKKKNKGKVGLEGGSGGKTLIANESESLLVHEVPSDTKARVQLLSPG